MKVDLHNHTTLCNHATGSVDEYVEAAIESGTEYFGFSDHAPMRYDLEYRMNFDQMDLYESWVRNASEKYQEKITVLLGYEVDYIPGYVDERVLNRPCDYLIGSVHFIDEWGFDNPEYIHRYQGMDMDAIYIRYFDLVEQMALSGQFDIVGHFDLLKVFNFFPKSDIRLLAQKALKVIKKADMAIELNVAGLRKPVAEAYPSSYLLEAIAELEIPITFGSDAHRPDQVGMFSGEIETLAKKFGYRECATYRNRERQMIKF
ncbi:MAG: histidinol-phosphatase HisJ family protein [Sulfuricurvum sp.]|uniref:histidinol-phosphatase HisJ family protein n=1 Tax=Sulfuricurvum sp. TaxID=2025608 RepID=UPI0026188CC0|nr:histidinol-phosphatase HisJ family protein [Sulfuricurvum sp.]MDD2829394.1 histidinol-phosphatase HisJ family protein [Sulfuricurvum sp.]MDD4948244.1 histidinol-phosphatase HisJ family protein [Sulfuricurvum sp.]